MNAEGFAMYSDRDDLIGLGLSLLIAVVFVAFVLGLGFLVENVIAAQPDDYGPTLQAAMDAMVDDNPAWPDTSGGTIRITGRHTIRTPVVVPCHGITVAGDGGPHTLCCELLWAGSADEAMFVLPVEVQRSARGFALRDIVLRGNRAGTAIRWKVAEKRYGTGWHLHNVAIRYFAIAMEVTGEDSAGIGGLHAIESDLRFNGQILVAIQAPINESTFQRSILSAPLGGEQYSIDVAGSGPLRIFDCLCEQQVRLLRVAGTAPRSVDISVENCRFERNKPSDDPVMLIEDCRGVRFRDNHHRIGQAEQESDTATLHLRFCDDVEIVNSKLRRIVVDRREVVENQWEPRW